ncbi:C5a anaphylatoxin chemotactic receptor 1-like [Leptodactylus fuscus]|uniref:C5a anaphylatoxin chemotactic receptor 1-like n=1 Tax=Leptodactylus fuscus TaxID=238119 RepID=UPI003F4EED3E
MEFLDDYEIYYDLNFTLPTIMSPKDEYGHNLVSHWIAVCLYILVFILGVPGNGFVVWITGFEMKRSVNTTWFLNLAVADLLCCLSLPVGIMEIVLGYWPLGLVACKIIPAIFLINMYASILLLTMISIDRCALVMKPVWCQNHRTLGKAYMACAVTWILAILLNSPGLIFRTIWEDNGKAFCVLHYGLVKHHRQMVQNIIAFCHLLIGFVIPFLVIIFCYTMLIHRVKLRFTQNTKTTKVSIVVIVGFFVCWFPYHVLKAIWAMNENTSSLYMSVEKVQDIFIALAFVNSCINPIIYVLIGQGFKRKFKNSVKVILKNVLQDEMTPSDDSNKTSLTSKNTETSI